MSAINTLLSEQHAPTTEQELLARTELLTGRTLGDIFNAAESMSHAATRDSSAKSMPEKNLRSHKGTIGQCFERLLGTDAGNAAAPDFVSLGIELKTLPIGKNGQPCESTFVTTIPLTQIHQETWETSRVYHKLKQVLWVPLEGDRQIPFSERRIGQAFLWSPNTEQTTILKNDWEELTNHIALGQLETISAKSGTYLQIRPKGANGKSLSWGVDEHGDKIKTLPRGFYLRSTFTTEIYRDLVCYIE